MRLLYKGCPKLLKDVLFQRFRQSFPRSGSAVPSRQTVWAQVLQEKTEMRVYFLHHSPKYFWVEVVWMELRAEQQSHKAWSPLGTCQISSRKSCFSACCILQHWSQLFIKPMQITSKKYIALTLTKNPVNPHSSNLFMEGKLLLHIGLINILL